MTWPITSAPRGQSCTVSNCHLAKTMPYQQKSGAKDLFQIIFFLQGCNSNFFFTGTKIIFKPNTNAILPIFFLRKLKSRVIFKKNYEYLSFSHLILKKYKNKFGNPLPNSTKPRH